MPEPVAASCICELVGGNGADQILGPAAGHISRLRIRPSSPNASPLLRILGEVEELAQARSPA